MNPQKDLVTHTFKRDILLISNDHLHLLFDVVDIITKSGLD